MGQYGLSEAYYHRYATLEPDRQGVGVRHRRQQPHTLDQLRAEECQRIAQAFINRLVVSTRRCCVAVINSRGSFTRY